MLKRERDTINRIGKNIAWHESTITPTPEVLAKARLHLGHLACEALEEAGQLILFTEEEV